MPLDFIAKKLFARLSSWERRRRVKMTIIVVLVALIFGGLIGLVIFLKNSQYHH